MQICITANRQTARMNLKSRTARILPARLTALLVPLVILCALGSTPIGAAVLPDEVGQALDRQTRAFVAAEGHDTLDLDQDFWDERYYTPGRFPEMVAGGPSLPDAHLRPVARAILLLEAYEGVLPRVRYKLEYRRAPSPDENFPLEIGHIQLTRFNLGPELRRQAVSAYGAESVAPAKAFGVGPHVRWRLVLQPAMTQVADVVAISRRVLSDAEAEAIDCLGTPCLSTDPACGPEDGWKPLPSPPATATVSRSRPAIAAADLGEALQGDAAYGESSEGGSDSEPQLILVISAGIDGQDPPVAAVGQVPNALDDAIEQYWIRRIESDTSVDWERRFIYRPGRS